jgi:nucleoside-diphosphate-sugar epimerase/dTDP-4-dehydrorhamnose 3,5-epimerase-like enzyme
MIFILGINSFIARNFYLKVRKNNKEVTCLNHNDIDNLFGIKNEDIILNFCGINRGENKNDYDMANFIFIKKIINKLNDLNVIPYFLHVSSFMVYGFVDKDISVLPLYQQYFINSKLEGEVYLKNNYPANKFCIVRPSNIYGYDCEPYANNLLVTLIYEKIKKNIKINKINKNCVRNFLSIDELCNALEEIITNKKIGIFNILSNNNVNLESLINILYDSNHPTEIIIENNESSILNINNKFISGESIIINENLKNNIIDIEQKMEKYIKLSELVTIKQLNKLTQPRGDMVEISDLESKRLYMITLTDHSIRGNHYHHTQIEHFFQHRGKVIFVLVHKDNPTIMFLKIINENNMVIVNPLIIHTLINDFLSNQCEVFVVSTQKYIKNETPDTVYINIFNN